jgi:hypothetical protein
MIRLVFPFCVLFAFSAAAQAQDAAVPSSTVALTPEQREAALEAGAARDESLQYGTTDRRVHGEMGVEVGSRGERAAYGTMVAPIGQNGVASISYSTGQGPRWHSRRHFRDSSVGGAISSEAPTPSPPAGAESVNPD